MYVPAKLCVFIVTAGTTRVDALDASLESATLQLISDPCAYCSTHGLTFVPLANIVTHSTTLQTYDHTVLVENCFSVTLFCFIPVTV